MIVNRIKDTELKRKVLELMKELNKVARLKSTILKKKKAFSLTQQ